MPQRRSTAHRCRAISARRWTGRARSSPATAAATRWASAPARLRKVVEEKNIPADIKVYPAAGPSFANQLPAQPLMRIAGFGYNETATEDAWSRVFAFFGEHLRDGGTAG